MNYKVTKSSTVLVPPAGPTPSGMLYLSDLDLIAITNIDFMSVFSHGKKPAIQIKEAFAKALIHYYPVAGRIVWTKEDALYKPVVHCTGEGIWFVEAVADCTLADVECFETSHIRPNDEMLPRPPAGVELKNQIFVAQITEFTCGGFCVGIWFNHMIFDGEGAAQFLKAVGEMACGMSEPTVKPVWCRQDITYPPLNLTTAGNVTTSLTFNFTSFVVDIPLDSINRIKDLFLSETGETCTIFDVTTAMIFKSRVKAINLAPKDEVRVTIAACTRRLLQDKFPSIKGHYGNCGYAIVIVKTSEEINNASLIEVITLVKHSKETSLNKFMDWMKGEFHKHLPVPSYGNLIVSDWRRLGFNEVDYGWGQPKYVHSELSGCAIYLQPPVPKQGVRMGLRCVEEEHKTEFCRELEKIQVM